MTPEQIEEIKGKVAEILSEGFEGGSKKTSADKWVEYKTKMLEIFEEDVPELLAALEEAQRKLTERELMLKESLDIATRLDGRLEEAQQQAKKWEETARTEYGINNKNQDTNIDLRKQLVEEQQTIARQQEALEFYAKKEHWELPHFGKGHSRITSDGGSKARELLVAALGVNKEGSDKPCKHENVRNTGDIMVLSDGYEAGIAVCKDCGKEVPERDGQGKS